VKKVLIIENSLYVTGGLNAVLSSTEQLKNHFEFHFIIPAKSSIEQILVSKGYKVSKLPFLELSKSIQSVLYLPKLYRNSRKVLQYIKEEGIDVVHVNDIFNMVGCLAKRMRPSTKLVYHVRLLKTSYIGPLYPFFSKQVIKYADVIICVSEAVRTDLGNPEKAEVIYDRPITHNNYGDWNGLLVPNAIRILYLGNYIRGKGQQHGLRAFIELQKKYPASSIQFVGLVNDKASMKFRDELIELAKEAGVISKVKFSKKTTDVEKEMKSQDVVLNLSESESFSFVCLEALLYGVPLVVSDSGGPAEITDNGKMAFLVPNKNYFAAADALALIVEDTEQVKKRAVRAKEWANEKFDASVAKGKIAKLYLNLVNETRFKSC
jgi:L-malate glycosyltransferase